jgi:hypothetical protein
MSPARRVRFTPSLEEVPPDPNRKETETPIADQAMGDLIVSYRRRCIMESIDGTTTPAACCRAAR